MRKHQENSSVGGSSSGKLSRLFGALIFILFAGIIGASFPSTPAYAKDKVTFAIDEWTPFFSKNLPNYGPLSEIVRLALAEVGIQVEYDFVPWKRGYVMAVAGEYDGTPGWVWTEKRAAKFYFSDKILVQEEYLFYSKSRPLRAKTIDDLAGLTMGLHIGSMIVKELQPLLKRGEMKVAENSSYKALFRMMMKGRVDYISLGSFVGIGTMRKALPREQWDQVGFIKNLIKPVNYHLIVPKSKKDGPELINAFNKGLRALRKSGEYERILRPVYGD